MLEKFKTLSAAIALESFTISEISKHCSVAESTVQKIINRCIKQDSRIFTKSRILGSGRGRHRLRYTANKDLLRNLLQDAADSISLPSPTDFGLGSDFALSLAEATLTETFPDTARPSRVNVLQTALLQLEMADPKADIDRFVGLYSLHSSLLILVETEEFLRSEPIFSGSAEALGLAFDALLRREAREERENDVLLRESVANAVSGLLLSLKHAGKGITTEAQSAGFHHWDRVAAAVMATIMSPFWMDVAGDLMDSQLLIPENKSQISKRHYHEVPGVMTSGSRSFPLVTGGHWFTGSMTGLHSYYPNLLGTNPGDYLGSSLEGAEILRLDVSEMDLEHYRPNTRGFPTGILSETVVSSLDISLDSGLIVGAEYDGTRSFGSPLGFSHRQAVSFEHVVWEGQRYILRDADMHGLGDRLPPPVQSRKALYFQISSDLEIIRFVLFPGKGIPVYADGSDGGSLYQSQHEQLIGDAIWLDCNRAGQILSAHVSNVQTGSLSPFPFQNLQYTSRLDGFVLNKGSNPISNVHQTMIAWNSTKQLRLG